MKKESFLKGTLILITANAISKILGAALKIPLAYLLGEQGMAIYQTSFSVYIMLLSLITSGLPFSLSKYISAELAFSRLGNIRFAMRFSAVILLFCGLFLSLALFFGADFFALAMKDEKAALAIKAISPSIFFVAVGTAYKSCFQGYAHQAPAAVSQVTESFIKLVAGYFLASFFSAFSVKYSSAAAIFGVTIGEAFATLILFLMYIPYRRETRGFSAEHSRRRIISAIFSFAVPLTAVSVISESLSLLETSVIRNRLTSIVFTESSAAHFRALYSRYTPIFDDLCAGSRLRADGARWLYGAYSGYAATVFNLPLGMLAAFTSAILPAVIRCIALKNQRSLDFTVTSAAKIILTAALPCSIFLGIFSGEILQLLFRNSASRAMLSCLAPLLAISALTQLVCSVLYCSGEIFRPFLYSAAASGLKIILSFFLIAIPELNIFGAIIGSFFALSLRLILNVRLLRRTFGIKIISPADGTKLIFCGALSGALALSFYKPLRLLSGNDICALALSVGTASCAYLFAVFLSGLIKKEEIEKLRK